MNQLREFEAQVVGQRFQIRSAVGHPPPRALVVTGCLFRIPSAPLRLVLRDLLEGLHDLPRPLGAQPRLRARTVRKAGARSHGATPEGRRLACRRTYPGGRRRPGEVGDGRFRERQAREPELLAHPEAGDLATPGGAQQRVLRHAEEGGGLGRG